MWNCGRSRRRAFPIKSDGRRRRTKCSKTKKGLEDLTSFTRGRMEWEGCGNSGPYKIHENERRSLLEYEGKG